jgi:hypothetical protein
MNLDLRHLADDDVAELPPAVSAPTPLACQWLMADVQLRNRVAVRVMCVVAGVLGLLATVFVSPALAAGSVPATAAAVPR